MLTCESAASRLSREGMVALVAFAAGLSITSRGVAQEFELDQFDPAVLPTDGFVINTADDLGHKRFGMQVYLEYADDPLVFETNLGSPNSESIQVVHQQLTGHLELAAGFWDRVIFSVGLPYSFILKERASDFGTGSAAEGALISGLQPVGGGLGDIALGARGRVWGERSDLFQIALQGTLMFHTASLADSTQKYRGESGISGEIEVPFTFNVIEQLRISGNLGFRIRPNQQLLSDPDGVGVRQPLNLVVGDEMTYGVGAIVELFERKLAVIAEWYGRTGINSGFGKREQSPMELLGGAKYHHPTGFTAGAGAGMGIQRGYGAPDFRVFGMIGFGMPEPKPEPVEEPPPCEAGPEDVDGFEDEDGCLDADNDKDNVLDVDDACPNEAGPAQNKGCPYPDRDGDGVLDRVDNCPDEPGLVEYQGCQAKQLVQITDERIEILEKVYFKTNSHKLLQRSHALLDNVAEVLNAHPEIALVRVEGHTDARGSASYNKKLSQRRAESVVQYLIDAGVDDARLVAEGFGEERLVVSDATTREEHAQNRRVEFNIGKQEGIEQQESGPESDTIDR